jgi:hypothetical protein
MQCGAGGGDEGRGAREWRQPVIDVGWVKEHGSVPVERDRKRERERERERET